MPTNRHRYTVNIPPDLAAAVRARAKALNRSIANYLEWLVKRDLERESIENEKPICSEKSISIDIDDINREVKKKFRSTKPKNGGGYPASSGAHK